MFYFQSVYIRFPKEHASEHSIYLRFLLFLLHFLRLHHAFSTMSFVSIQVHNGLAIIRPPGHHAEADESCGFCFLNNVAIAARYAQTQHKMRKVLIVDWDIHFGNGIQHVFYEDPSVLYISLHRYDNGDYFPGLTEACIQSVGKDSGEDLEST